MQSKAKPYKGWKKVIKTVTKKEEGTEGGQPR